MQGHEVQGKFYHYNKNQEDEIFGTRHPVFIRGARSNPGKGEITMPFVDMGLSTALIQVEDAISSNGTVQGVLQKKGITVQSYLQMFQISVCMLRYGHW